MPSSNVFDLEQETSMEIHKTWDGRVLKAQRQSMWHQGGCDVRKSGATTGIHISPALETIHWVASKNSTLAKPDFTTPRGDGKFDACVRVGLRIFMIYLPYSRALVNDFQEWTCWHNRMQKEYKRTALRVYARKSSIWKPRLYIQDSHGKAACIDPWSLPLERWNRYWRCQWGWGPDTLGLWHHPLPENEVHWCRVVGNFPALHGAMPETHPWQFAKLLFTSLR